MITTHDFDMTFGDVPSFIGRLWKCWSCSYVFILGCLDVQQSTEEVDKPNFCPACGMPAKEFEAN